MTSKQRLEHRVIVDLGCGREPWPTYTYRKYRLRAGDRYIGVDYFPGTLEKARELVARHRLSGTFEFIAANYLDRWPFQDESATEVHLHMPLPDSGSRRAEEIRKKLKRLKRGGKFPGRWTPNHGWVPLELEHFLGEARRILIPSGEVYMTAEYDIIHPLLTEEEAERNGFYSDSSAPRPTISDMLFHPVRTWYGYLPFTDYAFYGRDTVFFAHLKKFKSQDNEISR